MIESRIGTCMKRFRRLLPLSVLAVAALVGLLYARASSSPSVEATLAAIPPVADSNSDINNDGTPDFLLLDGADAEAFRRWFTFLAESTAYQEQIPAEIKDCAALLRFAYREALRAHDGQWASGLHLPLPPALPPIHKYRYPFTPLAASLFRVRSGGFAPTDLNDGTFAQFADAETLRRHNTHFISKDIRSAQTGDLLFYHQPDQDMPDHAMIFIGNSSFEPDSQQWIVYHTGPLNAAGVEKGEIRRRSTEDLLHHKEPRWHPVPSNLSFLGVYRWNILQ